MTFKKIFLLALIIIISIPEKVIAQNDWENEQVTQINKEAPTSTLYYDDNLENIELLNGKWNFSWYANPSDVPAYHKIKFENKIQVPGAWQMQGFGKPIYRNTKYPFDVNPPFVKGMYGNPVGVYERTFSVKNLDNKTTYVRFESVSSAFYLWVNDQKVGYSQDSWSPAEFNITKYLKEGENTPLERDGDVDGPMLWDQTLRQKGPVGSASGDQAVPIPRPVLQSKPHTVLGSRVAPKFPLGAPFVRALQ